MKKGRYLEALLKSPNTVFSIKDISLLWGEDINSTARVRLSGYVKRGKLINIYRGFYAKDKDYDVLELASKIYTPSYISFETVLTRTGVIFQRYDSIFLASYVARDVKVDKQKISYIRMKNYVLSDSSGIDYKKNIAVATKERAFLDRVYVSKDYYFDSLRSLNWEKVFDLLPIYNNKEMEKRVNSYYKKHDC